MNGIPPHPFPCYLLSLSLLVPAQARLFARKSVSVPRTGTNLAPITNWARRSVPAPFLLKGHHLKMEKEALVKGAPR